MIMRKYTMFEGDVDTFDFRGQLIQNKIFNDVKSSSLSDRLSLGKVLGTIFNGCVFEVSPDDLDVGTVGLTDVGGSEDVFFYNSFFTADQTFNPYITQSALFEIPNITYRNCTLFDFRFGDWENPLELKSNFKGCTFEEVHFTKFCKTPTLTTMKECEFHDTRFTYQSMATFEGLDISESIFFDCVFDQVLAADMRSDDLQRCIVDDKYIYKKSYALSRNDGKEAALLAADKTKLSEFQNCTFQGLMMYRRTPDSPYADKSASVISFPQKGIETCTFDVYFPAKDTGQWNKGQFVRGITNTQMSEDFGYGTLDLENQRENLFNKYDDEYESFDDFLDDYDLWKVTAFDKDTLLRAKKLIWRFWFEMYHLHINGEASSEPLYFGIDNNGGLSNFIFENCDVTFYGSLDIYDGLDRSPPALRSGNFKNSKVHIDAPSMDVESRFKDCIVSGIFYIYENFYMSTESSSMYFKNCDFRGQTLELKTKYHKLNKLIENMSYLFRECIVDEDTKITFLDYGVGRGDMPPFTLDELLAFGEDTFVKG